LPYMSAKAAGSELASDRRTSTTSSVQTEPLGSLLAEVRTDPAQRQHVRREHSALSSSLPGGPASFPGPIPSGTANQFSMPHATLDHPHRNCWRWENIFVPQSVGRTWRG